MTTLATQAQSVTHDADAFLILDATGLLDCGSDGVDLG